MSARLLPLVLIAALLGAGCSNRADAGAAGPLVVVLFDVSQSTRAPEVRDRYAEAFDRVLAYAADADGRVIADVIDENPLAHSSYPIDVAFSSCDAFTENPLVCDAEATKLREEASAEARAILARTAGESGTDIHDALALAERAFDAYPESGVCSLVLLSDMVERSASLNVVRVSAQEPPGSAIDALAADGSIPDLNGVSVYVVGAGVQSGTELSAEQILAIQGFWQAFFERGGARFAPERYGAALVRFP